MENLYSIDSAAKMLGGISRHTIVSWLTKGKLQRTKVGHRTMIRESELQRFLEASADQTAHDGHREAQ